MSEAENIWEQTMKEVIGEDQPENAADVIRRLQDDLANERSKRRSLQLQNQGLMMNQKAAGLCISYALEGKSRPEDRWWMVEMEKVRDMAADRDALAARVERLGSEMEKVRDVLDMSDIDCLGTACRQGCPPWPIRDEVIDGITKTLNETKPAALSRVRVEIAEKAYMQGQIDQGIDPSHSDATAYAQRLIDQTEVE